MMGDVNLESDKQAELAQEVLESMLLGPPTTTPAIPTRTPVSNFFFNFQKKIYFVLIDIFFNFQKYIYFVFKKSNTLVLIFNFF